MVIFVDADGCPVVDVAIKVAKEYNIRIVVVKNYAVWLDDPYAEIVSVDVSRDSADYYIANRINKGDILITQDYGLAAMGLTKGAYCINQNGFYITDENISSLLDRRHINASLRRKKIYTKFKKRSSQADENFERSLISLIEKLQAES
ncbi:MAG: YaiI/YqxD family protein [Tissierellia bacterium]|nr:YaiI/YqxD family protein [Tissierellia bacterium]